MINDIFDTPEIPDEPADPYIAPTEHNLDYVLPFKQFKGKTIRDVINTNHGGYIHWLCENLPNFSLEDEAWQYLQQNPQVSATKKHQEVQQEEEDDNWLSDTFDDPRDDGYGSGGEADEPTMASYYDI